MRRSITLLLSGLAALGLLASCASKEAMNLKIHTDPEGSHVIYRVSDSYKSEDEPWIYLGLTPYQGVTVIDWSALGDTDTVTFKVMRHGYLDQTKKWTGTQFEEEYEREGMLFWAPRLIKAGQ